MSNQKQLYEGMFLLNPAAINSSLAQATQIINEFLNRAEADVEALYRWDERRLAYEIKGQKRGLYMLAYFRAEGPKIAGIERDVNLSEQVIRCMIIRAEHIGDAELETARQKHAETLDATAVEGEHASGDDEKKAEAAGSSSQ